MSIKMNNLLSQFQQPLTPAETDGQTMTPWEAMAQSKKLEEENKKTELMNDAANRMKAENNILKAAKEKARILMEPVSNKNG